MTIRNALVIGAGSGSRVGRATADALIAAGVRVLAAGRERDATDPAQRERERDAHPALPLPRPRTPPSLTLCRY
ncbi:hypothetical protein ACWD5V_33700 [Streptomyces sp. NPDC002523]